ADVPVAGDLSTHRPRTARVDPTTYTPLAVTFLPFSRFPPPRTLRPATAPSAPGQRSNHRNHPDRPTLRAIHAASPITPCKEHATSVALKRDQLRNTRWEDGVRMSCRGCAVHGLGTLPASALRRLRRLKRGAPMAAGL